MEQNMLLKAQEDYNKYGFKYLSLLDDIEEKIDTPITDESIEAIKKAIENLSVPTIFDEANQIMERLKVGSKVLIEHNKEIFLSIYPMSLLEGNETKVKTKLSEKLSSLNSLLESEIHKDDVKRKFSEVAAKITVYYINLENCI